MNRDEQEIQHERLCAWLLGELSPQEAAEVEEAVSRSPELQATHERLAQTIGLVQGAMEAPTELSESRFTEILGSLETEDTGTREADVLPMPLPWYRHQGVRVAAGLLVLVGGSALLLTPDLLVSERVLVSVAEDQEPATGEPQTNQQAPPRELQEPFKKSREEARLGLLERGVSIKTEEHIVGGLSALGYLASDTAVDGQGDLAKSQGPGAGEAATPSPASPGAPATKEESGQGIPGSSGSPVAANRNLGRPLGGGGGGSAVNYTYTGQDPAARVGSAAQEIRLGQPGPEAAIITGSDGFFLGSGKGIGIPDGGLDAVDRVSDLNGDREVRDGASAQGQEHAEAGRARGREAESLPQGQEGEAIIPDFELVDQTETDVNEDFRDSAGAPEGRSSVWFTERADELQTQLCRDLQRRPGETPRDMFFRFYGDNAFQQAKTDSFSTFAADVDTASYVLARRYLNEGYLPVKAQIRTEEFLNYPSPDLPPPAEGTFSVHTELAPSLFGGEVEDRWMLRVGLRGQELAEESRPPLNITFVVDVSGSMKEDQRLELVKHAMRLLLTRLKPDDRVGVIAYSREARLVLPLTPASQTALIESAIHPLSPDGGTNAEAGLKMGYELALTGLSPASHSRVVLLSDGVANIGQTNQDRINNDVARQRAAGIYLNTIGVGMDNHNDVFLEQLANKGDGVCDYIDSRQARNRGSLHERHATPGE